MAKITLAPGVTKDDFISDKFVIYERNGQHYIRLKSKKKERVLKKSMHLMVGVITIFCCLYFS